jgi:hypothetical protein
MARAAGRAPERLEVVVRANVQVTEKPLGVSRPPFSGSFDELKRDIEAVRRLDVSELFFDPTFSLPEAPGAFLERLRAAA